MAQIQAATVSALPQQVHRDARPTSTPAADTGALNITEKLAKSTEAGDRDAQEQYQGPAPSPENRESPPEGQASGDDPSSIWTLSVADDQPPPDLDIRG